MKPRVWRDKAEAVGNAEEVSIGFETAEETGADETRSIRSRVGYEAGFKGGENGGEFGGDDGREVGMGWG